MGVRPRSSVARDAKYDYAGPLERTLLHHDDGKNASQASARADQGLSFLHRPLRDRGRLQLPAVTLERREQALNTPKRAY